MARPRADQLPVVEGDGSFAPPHDPGVRKAMNLIDNESIAPARDRQQLWLGLFDVPIGNCDAHGKNHSLLYDSPAPSLTPYDDLVFTVIYEGLTTRLCRSTARLTWVGVERQAWARLTPEFGFAPAFWSSSV